MDENLALPVPDAVTATYVVPANYPPRDPEAVVRDYAAARLTPAHRQMVLDMLGESLLSVLVDPADQRPAAPADLLRAFGARAADLVTLTMASHVITVQATFQPGWPPLHEWAARAAAAGLAGPLGTPILDTFTPVLISSRAAERTFPDEDGSMRLTDWVLVVQSPQPSGFWVTTRGLGRFGLPELSTADVPPQLAPAWGRAVLGLARALLRWWVTELARTPRPPLAELPSTLEFSLSDVSAAHEQPAPEVNRSAPVRLKLLPGSGSGPGPGSGPGSGSGSLLAVEPPDSFSGSAVEFIAAVCADLFGGAWRQVRVAADDDTMREAIATAQAGLTRARERYLAGDLGPGRKLMVKFRLETEHGQEFAWAYVTSWADPAAALGASASNSLHDGRVRVGAAVTIPASDVIDWGIWADGEGMLEGGWTDKVLTG